MPYFTSGSLTSSKLTIEDQDAWDTQTEWEAYQSINQVVINSGVLELDQTFSTVDDFEWGGPFSNRYSGTTGNYAIDGTTPVQEGSYSLKWSGSLTQDFAVSYPGDGLPNYPQRADRVRWFTQVQSSDSLALVVLFASSGTQISDISGYRFGLSAANSRIEINRHDNGSFNLLASTSYSPSLNTWYMMDLYSSSTDFQLELRTPDMTVDDAPLASVSATDNNYSGQGTGYSSRDGEVWDDVKLELNVGIP